MSQLRRCGDFRFRDFLMAKDTIEHHCEGSVSVGQTLSRIWDPMGTA